MRDEDWTVFRSLNLGCGNKDYPNCVNVDLRETFITHFLWDLNVTPYPFPDNRFICVYAQDIIEHLDNIIPVMNEIHRILEPEGKVHIRTAAWDTAQSYNDPTHKHWFTPDSFDFFDPNTVWGQKYLHYTPHKYTVLVKRKSGDELEFVLEKRS